MQIKKQTIERIIITFHYEERHRAFQYCENNNLTIIQSGPQAFNGKASPQIFKIIAEKESLS